MSLPLGRFVHTARHLLSFKVRYVRTAAGSARYKVPIGSPIPEGRRGRPSSGGGGASRKNSDTAVPAPARKPATPRTVRTEAGAKRYGVPVGAPIPLGRRVKSAPKHDGQQPKTDTPTRPLSPTELADDYRSQVGDVPTGERKALHNYTGGEFVGVNDYLRNGPTWANEWADKPIADLNNLMGRYRTPQDVTVVRGANGSRIPPQGQAVGKVIESAGFQSTTIGNDVVPEFQHYPTVMQITVPKGSHAIVVNGTGKGKADENEMILPHGTRYVITGDETRGGKRWVTATALPPNP